jgi:uncharacterized membrane protein
MNFIKATVTGGLVFLVPVVIAVAVLGKALGIMRALISPLREFIPQMTIGGVALINLLVLMALVLICFAAGLLARSRPAASIYRSLDKVLLSIPGYAFIKGFTESMGHTEGAARTFNPALVYFDDYTQIGLEVERTGNNVVIYLPDAPNPWSGSVIHIHADRVKQLAIPVAQALSSIRKIGLGSAGLTDLQQ